MFAKKDVAVIGGGNSGLEATLQLMNIAHQVYLVTNGSTLTGDEIMQEKVKKQHNVKILTKSVVKEILGDTLVHSIIIDHDGAEKRIDVRGVFT